jgi:NAD(P) transhydrogenase subunit beta
MNSSLATVAYIGATILFILSLGGLSNQETARRGNLYGMVGMALAVLATVFGPQVTAEGIPMIVGAMLVGAVIGLYAARKVQMTQMPELVALMHSMVGMAAVLVGLAAYLNPEAFGILLPDGTINPVSRIEMGLGISYQVSCGNAADLDLMDYASFMLESESTRVVLMLAERVSE